jgi:hypothetical protein
MQLIASACLRSHFNAAVTLSLVYLHWQRPLQTFKLPICNRSTCPQMVFMHWRSGRDIVLFDCLIVTHFLFYVWIV